MIVVVVDGSTDETLKIAENIASQHPEQVKIICQENAGPATARNTGLNHVNTEYVTFLDADDMWLPNYAETIIPLFSRNPDLIEYDAFRVCDDNSLIGTLKIAVSPFEEVTIIEAFEFTSIFRCYAWARVYRTSNVRAHPFPSNRRFEDTATTPWHYWNSNKTISVGRALIAYRQHSTSILSTPMEKDIEEICTAVREAATMYSKTKSPFWQQTTYRIFRFACQRTIKLPAHRWPKYARLGRESVGNVPPPPGFLRKFQRRSTLIYIVLLSFRHITSDLFLKLVPAKLARAIYPVH